MLFIIIHYGKGLGINVGFELGIELVIGIDLMGIGTWDYGQGIGICYV